MTAIPEYEYPGQTAEKRESAQSLETAIMYLNPNLHIVEWADLEALDISKLNQPGGKQELAAQVLRFIDKNGMCMIEVKELS
jgi:hypothetical protein